MMLLIFFFYIHSTDEKNEPGHSISFKIASAPSEDSDQTAHLRSLNRVFTRHSVRSQGSKASSDGQRRL